MKIHTPLLAAVAAVALTAAAGCGADQTGGSGSAPIVVGSVNTLSGAATFPEASQAAKAVFDEVNAQGGINGRKISYVTSDDKGDPAAAAQAARDLIQNKQAVVLAGGASLLDCQVNGPFYTQSGIVSVQGTGVDPGCFTSPNVSPVNTGPYFGTTLALYYASEQLKLDKLCAFITIIGGTSDAYKEGVARWSKMTGKKLLIEDNSLSISTTDFTPYILRARDAGCQAVLFNGIEPMAVGWVKTAAAQKVTGVKWLFLTSAYTAQAAKAFGAEGKDVLALSEFEPYTDESSAATKDWRATMTKHNVPLTSFAEGGYLAATHLVTVLKGIKGDITRESVTKAFQSMAPLTSPLTGSPFGFGGGDAHASNLSGKFVQPDNGGWTVVTPEWVRLPNA